MARKTKKNLEADSNLKTNESTNSQSVGYILKNTRIVKGLSLEDISRSLCITKSFLIRLEDQCETLPVDVYTLGFIRAYSKFLDADSDALIKQFKASNVTTEYDETLVFPKPLPRRGIPHIKVVSISLAFALLLTLGWETITRMSPMGTDSLDLKKLSLADNAAPLMPVAFKEMESPKEEVKEIIKVAAIDAQPVKNKSIEPEILSEAMTTSSTTHPVEKGSFVATSDTPVTNSTHEEIAQKVIFESNAPVSTPSQEHSSSPSSLDSLLNDSQGLPLSSQSTTPSTPQGHKVAITFTEKTWVQVKDAQDQIVLNRTFNPGDKYEFKETQGYVLKTGNAGGVHVTLNNEDIGQLGNAGEVVGNISLDPENLLAQHPKTY